MGGAGGLLRPGKGATVDGSWAPATYDVAQRLRWTRDTCEHLYISIRSGRVGDVFDFCYGVYVVLLRQLLTAYLNELRLMVRAVTQYSGKAC